MVKKYKMLRGPVAEARCRNKRGTFGSPLYCECGCQTPRPEDPDLVLDGVTVVEKSPRGYADYVLARNGVKCGILNTQYNYVYIDQHEFLEVDRELLRGLLQQAWSLPSSDACLSPGETREETRSTADLAESTIISDQHQRNREHPGYCPKCGTYCYGDCEANR